MYERAIENGLALKINEAKKEYKRSPEYKETLIPRSSLTKDESRDLFAISAQNNGKNI